MNKRQKTILIIISSILLLVIIGIICINLSSSGKKQNSKENLEQEESKKVIQKDESKELLIKLNNLNKEVMNNIKMESSNEENATYNYTGDVNKLKDQLSKVYLKPYYENRMYELIFDGTQEKIKIHLPKDCHLKQVDVNSKISIGYKDSSSIDIGLYSYVVDKDKDNHWKFLIAIPICE